MGTYTTNYNLFLPTIGEQGWGTLVNGNFSTIDSTMAGLNTRLTAVENEVNGALSCTSVTTSGKVTANGGIGTTSLTTSSTITSTGLIAANGGVKGNLTGNASTATKLNKTVTIGVSSTTIEMFQIDFVICPYVPGVVYTGSIKTCTTYGSNSSSSNGIRFYKLSTNGTWSTTNLSCAAENTYSFSNIIYGVIFGINYSTKYTSGGIYSPTYT